MSLSSSEKNKRGQVFVLSALLGAIAFILVYGPYVLNPVYDGWIMGAVDRDLAQHYLGFCFYRSSPWSFPLGRITNASYPFDMSVIYTDAIPLLAFVGKLLDPVLPKTFQYLGIYGMLSMSLMGGTGGLLIYELTGRACASVVSSLFYALSWTVLYRMFYHTSLTSQWLILIAAYMWLRLEPEADIRRSLSAYIALSAAAVLIHPYLWAMCTGIIIMSLIDYLMRSRDLRRTTVYLIVYCLTGIICLWLFGAFIGDTDASLGIGTFEANLNTFYNSMGMAVLPGFSVAMRQYEGFGYLGVGILFLAVCCVCIALVRRRLPHVDPRRALFLITACIFILFSILPEISLNDRVLVELNLGRVYRYAAGIFRSNGRFIWPVCFFLMTAVISFVIRNIKGRSLALIVIFALLLQIADMMPFLKDRHEIYSASDRTYESYFDGHPALDEAMGQYDHIVADIGDAGLDKYQDLNYYAYLHGMTTSNFYYARPIDDRMDSYLEALRQEMSDGIYDDDSIFIIGEEKLPLYQGLDLHFYEVDGRYIASHRPIPGLDE